SRLTPGPAWPPGGFAPHSPPASVVAYLRNTCLSLPSEIVPGVFAGPRPGLKRSLRRVWPATAGTSPPVVQCAWLGPHWVLCHPQRGERPDNTVPQRHSL